MERTAQKALLDIEADGDGGEDGEAVGLMGVADGASIEVVE